jgi:predicted nicotinamide N-methyase
LRDVDVVLAGDVWYERAPSLRFRRWFDRLARRGHTVLTSDAGRGYAPKHAEELARYDVPTPYELDATPARTTRVLAYPTAPKG